MKKLFVFFAAIAMAGVFATSAIAADWNFYGSARMRTFWQNTEQAGQDDIKEWDWDLQGNSRIGATVKTNDVISGGFEYGSGPNLRKLYGTWDFGGGKFLVGQTYTPLVAFYSDQAWGSDEGLLSYGDLYGGRQPMLQVSMNNFKIALIKPSTAALLGKATDKMIPKIEGNYRMKMNEALSLDFFAGFNTIEVDDKDDIRSGAVGVGFVYEMGQLKVKGKIHLAQNPGNYGLAGKGACRSYDGSDDSESWGGIIVVGYKMDDMFSFQSGYGKAEHEVGSKDDDVDSLYFQAKINLAPGFFVVPEVGWADQGDGGKDISYAGAKWQINF